MSDAPFPTAAELAAFLGEVLGATDFPPAEQGGVYRDGDGRRVERLGLALEPWAEVGDWATAAGVDALFLHRPWRLAPDAPAGGVAVLWSHLPFDERLTTGDSAHLARTLGLAGREPIGTRDGRPLGMIGAVEPASAGEVAARVSRAFGGHESLLLPDPAAPVARVAVVGAMTAALVEEAAARGVGLYVTGQLRAPARAAVAACDIAVLAVGHARAEAWGLRALSDLVRVRWPRLRLQARTA